MRRQGFTQPREHGGIATARKRFRCEWCGFRFETEEELGSHYKTAHPKGFEPNVGGY